ncbi:MAG TPA: hypothetical protein VH989_12045 [Actinomycetota bacterium]|jgi:hypothetical protein
MFARYFVEIPLPVEFVDQVLSDDPGAWLPGLAERANHRGDTLLAEVGFGDKIRIVREVVVELGPPIRSSTKTAIPFRWVAASHAGLFPSLDADLEVAPLGDRTQLSISARYIAPFGAVGRVIDRAILSRVAEATLKKFLDGVADVIVQAHMAQLASGAGPTS